jgi:ankyrin repeat protein
MTIFHDMMQAVEQGPVAPGKPCLVTELLVEITGPHQVYTEQQADIFDLPLLNRKIPAHLAAGSNYLEVLRFFLNQDRDAGNQMDFNGDTAMHIAASSGHADVIRLLAAFHTNLNSTNHAGLTPLDLAKKEENTGAVRALVALDAKCAK